MLAEFFQTRTEVMTLLENVSVMANVRKGRKVRKTGPKLGPMMQPYLPLALALP